MNRFTWIVFWFFMLWFFGFEVVIGGYLIYVGYKFITRKNIKS